MPFLVRIVILLSCWICFLSYTRANFITPVYEEGKIFLKIKENDEFIQFRRNLPLSETIIKHYEVHSITKPFVGNEKAVDNPLGYIYLIEFKQIKLTEDFIQLLTKLPYVEYAEKIPVYESFYTPNDLNGAQWNLIKINAGQSWDIHRGSGKVIAVVDDAIRLTHEDLAANLWINTGEIPANGLDDDGNGFVDDLNGYDVADADANPSCPATSTNTEFTHGTHCAGIAAAVSDNSRGIASIGFSSKIMAVKCKSSATTGPSLPYAYLGLNYAIQAKADVISMSWGGSGYSQTYQLLINTAYNQGIVCVAAAGNSNSNIPFYPASYDHVISVAATTSNDTKAIFSNYGNSVDLCAPGVSIYSTLAGQDNAYGNLSGTSMACPLVAGLCAAMLSFDPTLTPDQLEACLKSSCDPIDPLNPGYSGLLGAGRINAYRSLTCLQKAPVADFSASKKNACPGEAITLTDLSQNMLFPGSNWYWSFSGAIPSFSSSQNPVISYPLPGTYSVSLTVTNPYGNNTLQKNAYITISTPSAVLSGSASIPTGGNALLKIDFSPGTGPWNIVYSDGTTNYPVNGINSNPYYFQVSPTTMTTYTLVSVNTSGCSGNVSGGAVINTISINPPTCPGALSFEKTFGGTNQDAGGNLIQLADSSYWITGQTQSYGAGISDYFIGRVDKTGNLQWMKTYGGTYEENIYRTILTSDGGLLSVGRTRSFGTSTWDIYVVKTDNLGNILWSKKYGGSKDEMGMDIQPTSDGGFIIAGRISIPGDYNIDGYLLKIDATGNLLWTRTIHTYNNDYIYNCHETSDGGYVVAGSKQNASPLLYDFFVAKLDASLNIVWSKNFGNSNQDDGTRRMVITPDGNILIGGHLRRTGPIGDALLLKMDAAGNYLWSKIFGGINFDDITDVTVDQDGNYLATGFTESYGNGLTDLFAIKTDPNGNVLWSKTYGGTNAETQPTFGCIRPTLDGGCAIMGTTLMGAGSTDAYFIKTDCNGNSGCNSRDVTFQYYTYTLSFPSPPCTLGSEGSSGNVSTQTNNAIPSIGNPCIIACNTTANFSASDTTFCKGTTVSFTNLSLNASTYKWFINQKQVSSSTSFSHLFDTGGTYEIILQALSGSSCSNVHSLMLTVNDVPPTDAIAADAFVCTLGSVQLYATGALQYTWTPSSGLSCTNCANPTASPFSSGYFFVTGTDAQGCSSRDSVFIRIRCCRNGIPSPRADFLISDSTLCLGENTSFQNTSFSSISNVVLSWDFGSTAIPSSSILAAPSSVIFTQPGRWPVRLIIQDSCSRDTIVQYVNVFSPPLSSVSGTSICHSDSIQYENLQIDTYSYRWTPVTGLSDSTIANPKIKAPLGSTSYKLRITEEATGCSYTDTIVVNVFSPPLSYAQDTMACYSDSIQYENLQTASYSYLWSPTTGLSDPTIANPRIKASLGNTTYKLHITDETTGCSYIDTVLVNIIPLPISSASDTLTCYSDSIQYDNLHVNTYSYRWTPATGLSDSTIANPKIKAFPGRTTYTIHVTDNITGCSYADTILIKSGQAVAHAGNDTIIVRGQTVPLKGCCGEIYSWFPPEMVSRPDVQNPYTTPNHSTLYILSVQDSLGCAAIDSVFIQILTETLFIPNLITLNNDDKNDQFEILGLCPGSKLEIYNRWNDLVYQTDNYQNDWKADNAVDGIYYFHLTHSCENNKTYKGWVHVLR